MPVIEGAPMVMLFPIDVVATSWPFKFVLRSLDGRLVNHVAPEEVNRVVDALVNTAVDEAKSE